jgi:hypothetical protein
MLPGMSQLPAPDMHFELNVRFAFHAACQQAFDQVKATIKNGHLPNDQHIQWVVAVGPYFIIKGCGPFTKADLETRGHRQNPSGDFNITEFLTALHQNAHSRPLGTPIYRIGTAEATQALQAYLTVNIHHFYSPNANRYTIDDFA